MKKYVSRSEAIKRMAEAYYSLLTVNSELLILNEDVFGGIKEGFSKFLSNLCINLRGKYKFQSAEYVSPKALELVKQGNTRDLIYEHMVPKEKYIQGPCLEAVKTRRPLSLAQIHELLDKYWHIALITTEEDKILNSLKLRKHMPENWDNIDILARYKKANIHLIDTNTLKNGQI